MNFDELKSKVDIAEIIGKFTSLGEPKGKYIKGIEHDSLTIDTHQQRYFWNSQGESGDVFDWVAKRTGLEFKEAVNEVARLAGLSAPRWSKAEAERTAKRKAAASVYDAALGYFQDQLKQAPAALQYVRSRGWDEETIDAAGLGYYPGPDGPLRKALRDAGVDLKSPIAQAILKIPKGMLIYPHKVMGETRYLSGRAIEGKRHYNLVENLVGTKQPYVNHVYSRSAEWLVVVEGQADAITLAQWGIAAVALCGVKGGDKALLSPLLRHKYIVLGLDADEAGRSATKGWAEALMRAGADAQRIRVLTWPEGDANAWLQAGGTDELALTAVEGGATWLEHLVQVVEADAYDDEDAAIFAIFEALITLPPFTVTKMRDDLSLRLKIRRQTFDELLKDARRRLDSEKQGKYLVKNGWMYHRYITLQGEEVLKSLVNADIRIVRDVLRDDGVEAKRVFVCSAVQDGVPLPPADVETADFARMNWTMDAWGSQVIVDADRNTERHLRAAIQTLSEEIQMQTLYNHTGWRVIEGERVFLTNGTSVGNDTVAVELDDKLGLYQLPSHPDDVTGAMQTSLKFLDVAPRRVTWPLWGAMWLAPLRSLVNVAFGLWVYGVTGTMKSTFTALALNHFGAKFDDKHLPADFIDTHNRILKTMSDAADVPLVVDDYAPQKDRASYDKYNRASAAIIRAIGNLAGKGRLNVNSTAMKSHDPKCMLIVTGEDLPTMESIVARLFTVELERGDVLVNNLSNLQREKERLPHAMAGYISYLADNWQDLETEIPARWRAHRAAAYQERTHMRLPEAVAGLFLGVEMGLDYAVRVGALNEASRNALHAEALQVLLGLADEQADRVREEKPELLFTRAILEMITQGAVHFKPKNDLGLGEGVIGDRQGPLIGWYDEQIYYVLGSAAYHQVVTHYRQRGEMFPVNVRTLWKNMAEEAMLIKNQTASGRIINTHQLWVDGRNQPGIIQIPRAKIDGSKDDKE
jgi:DNA primase